MFIVEKRAEDGKRRMVASPDNQRCCSTVEYSRSQSEVGNSSSRAAGDA